MADGSLPAGLLAGTAAEDLVPWEPVLTTRRSIRLANLARFLNSVREEGSLHREFPGVEYLLQLLLPGKITPLLDVPAFGGVVLPPSHDRNRAAWLYHWEALKASLINAAAAAGVHGELELRLADRPLMQQLAGVGLAAPNGQTVLCHAGDLVLAIDAGRSHLAYDAKLKPSLAHQPALGSTQHVGGVVVTTLPLVESLSIDAVDPIRVTQDPNSFLTDSQNARPGWVSSLSDGLSVLALPGLTPFRADVLFWLSTIVPAHDPKRLYSSTSAVMGGRAVVTLDNRPEDVAEMLVHETQHTKLGALNDHVGLLQGQDEPDLRSPWRQDLRPAEGILHGCFSFVAVAEYWFALAKAARGQQLVAESHTFLRRREVLAGCAALLRSRRLSSAGEEVVQAIVERAQKILVEEPCADVLRAVKASQSARDWVPFVQAMEGGVQRAKGAGE